MLKFMFIIVAAASVVRSAASVVRSALLQVRSVQRVHLVLQELQEL